MKSCAANQVTDGVSSNGSEGLLWKPDGWANTTSDSALGRTDGGQQFSRLSPFGLGCSGLSPVGFGWYPTSRAACTYAPPFGPPPVPSSYPSIKKTASIKNKNQDSQSVDPSFRPSREDRIRDDPSSWSVAEVKKWLQHIGAEAST